jgi:hypothetical protein
MWAHAAAYLSKFKIKLSLLPSFGMPQFFVVACRFFVVILTRILHHICVGAHTPFFAYFLFLMLSVHIFGATRLQHE